MTRLYRASYATAALLVAFLAATTAQTQRIQVVPNEAGRRVDVMIDGKPFTSYIWPDTLKKPTLFRCASAREPSPPLEPRKGSALTIRTMSVSGNHGDVNGLDF